MKNKYYILSMFAVLATVNMAIPSLSSAGDFASDGGAELSISGADPAFTFQPSPMVTIDGLTSDTAFSVVAVHDSVVGKENGEAYGMTSENSGLYLYRQPDASKVVVGANAGDMTSDFKRPSDT